MIELRVYEVVQGRPRLVERHNVTHRHEQERERLRGVLETAYPDRVNFRVEEYRV